MEASGLPRYQLSYEQWKSMLMPEDCDCKSCHWMDTDGDKLLLRNTSLPDHKYDQLYKQVLDKWRSQCPRWLSKPKLRSHKGNGAPRGVWAGTFTMAPTDPVNEDDMVIAIRKLFAQQTCPVEKYAWYLEYTENELPHIHFCYKRSDGTRIHSKVFKRIWKTWDESVAVGRGHRGGYHHICADTDAYMKYISKDKGRHDSNWPMSNE